MSSLQPDNQRYNLSRVFQLNWPYLLFLLLVTIHSLVFLRHGYAAHLDEGYLQSLAKRLLDGEIIFKDFYFLRTPLTVYWQAFLLTVFGEHYTLIWGRVLLVTQMSVATIAVSSLYFKYISKLELVALLCANYLVTTLLLNFPWYSYDGVFFAVISVVFLHKKHYFWCGVVACLAGMSKQNYFLLIPMLFAASAVLRSLGKDIQTLKMRSGLMVMAGSSIPFSIFIIYSIFGGFFTHFIQNAIILPSKVNSVGLIFSLFQNNSSALYYSVPIILLIAVLFYSGRRLVWIYAIAGIALGWWTIHAISGSILPYIFNLIYVTYAVALLALIEWWRAKEVRSQSFRPTILAALVSMSVIQYLAGFNYAGLLFAQIGAGFAIPFSYIAFKIASPSPFKNYVAAVLLASILISGLHYRNEFVYHDVSRDTPTIEFDNSKLKGIYSSERSVNNMESLLSAVDSLSDSDDYMFVFPDYPALYYLCDRRNPTPVGWFYKNEYDHAIFVESIKALIDNPPKLVLLHTKEPHELLANFVEENYLFSEKIGSLEIFVLVTGKDDSVDQETGIEKKT